MNDPTTKVVELRGKMLLRNSSRRTTIWVAVTLLLAGCFRAGSVYSEQKKTEVGTTENIELKKESPPEGGITYRYEKDGCSISLSVNDVKPGEQAAAISGAYCPTLPYKEKLALMASILQKVKEEGQLTNLVRAGPGPGEEICKGEVRNRLIEVTLDRLSDPEFVHRNPKRVAGPQKNHLEAGYVFQEADAFREYKTIFEKIGYRLTMQDFEGVIFDKVNRSEWPKDVKGLPKDVLIPCNAMVYFRATKMGG